MSTIAHTAQPATIEAPLPHWELEAKEPAPALTSIVRGYWGYAERTPGPMCRHELPTADIVLIVNLGDPLRLIQPDGEPLNISGGQGFIAGLHTRYTTTETTGSQAGLEFRLSPLGAYRLFRQPMHDLCNRSVDLRDIDAPWMTTLSERLLEEPGWASRFAACDAALQDQSSSMPRPSPEVAWAWRQLQRTGGRVAIATLCEELGWSPKRLIARFREQIGLPPKEASRLIRFQRVAASIAGNAGDDWDAFALRHGYFDQSHLIHECRRFAGDTPQGLRQRLLGPGSGFSAN
jgi:AraC-like DNA-binding protein